MESRHFLVGSIGFSLGILAYSYANFGFLGVLWCTGIGLLLFGFWFYKRQTAFLVASLFCITFALGAGRVLLAPASLPEPFLPFVGAEHLFEGRVVADPDIRETSQRLTVEVEAGGKTTRVLVIAPRFPEAHYGERVEVRGRLEYPEPFETDAKRTFRYDQFLAKDGIFAVISYADVSVVGAREGWWPVVRGTLSDFKTGGIDALAQALPEPQASLASGLILGGKQGLGQSLLDAFVTSGLIHIVVLSGYNVMIVAQFILALVGLVSRRFAPLIAGLTIAAFVLSAGAGPASIRAGIMAGIGLFALLGARTYDALRALLLAGLLMLVWNPLTLAFDPGFQLSFIATLGLIFGAPIFERILSFVRIQFLRDIISATLSAQIAVLPLLLYQNGLFSLIALPANILVLPLVPVAMLTSALAAFSGFLLPEMAPVLGFPAYLLLSLIIGIVEIAASLPLAAISIPAFPFVLVLLAYALLAWLVYQWSRLPPLKTAARRRSSLR